MTRSEDPQTDRQAADEAVSPSRLLDGEDPSSVFAEDARHWISTYQELVNFKRALLETTEQKIETMVNQDATAELESTDLIVIRAEAERFEERLHFWRRRLQKLEKV